MQAGPSGLLLQDWAETNRLTNGPLQEATPQVSGYPCRALSSPALHSSTPAGPLPIAVVGLDEQQAASSSFGSLQEMSRSRAGGYQKCWVWAEGEMQAEWQWLGNDMVGKDMDAQIDFYLGMTTQHYAMVRREAYTGAFTELLMSVDEHVGEMMDDW